MSYVSNEDWGYIVDHPMFPDSVYLCYQDALWLVKILRSKYELTLEDVTGCLDSGLL